MLLLLTLLGERERERFSERGGIFLLSSSFLLLVSIAGELFLSGIAKVFTTGVTSIFCFILSSDSFVFLIDPSSFLLSFLEVSISFFSEATCFLLGDLFFFSFDSLGFFSIARLVLTG